jgi:hypothetical protein
MPRAHPSRSVRTAEGRVGVTEHGHRVEQQVATGVAVALPADALQRAVAGKVLGLSAGGPMLIAVVLVQPVRPDDPEVAPRKRAPNRSRTSYCGSTGTSQTRCSTRSTDSHGDSDRVSTKSSAFRRAGAPRRRRALTWRSSRMSQWPACSAESVSTTRSSRPRSRPAASSASPGVASLSPPRLTVGTGWVWRHTTSPWRRGRLSQSAMPANTGASAGCGGSHQPYASAAVRSVDAREPGSTSCQACRSDCGSPPGAAARHLPALRREAGRIRR